MSDGFGVSFSQVRQFSLTNHTCRNSKMEAKKKKSVVFGTNHR